MNKHLIVLGIAVLLIYVGLSGCTEQTPTESQTDDSLSSENQLPSSFCSATTISGWAPLTVFFTGSGYDSDGSIISYSWDFGDGETSNLQNPSHTFNSEGIYTVALTVTDNEGGTDTDTITITALKTTEHTIGDEVMFTSDMGLLVEDVKTTVDYTYVSDYGGYLRTVKPDNPNYGYLWVYIKMKNYGDVTSDSFSVYYMKVTVAGVECERDTPTYSMPNLYGSISLEPSATSKGWIIYAIPKNAKDVKFVQETTGGDVVWHIPDFYINFQERNYDNLADGQSITFGSDEDYYEISLTHDRTVFSYTYRSSYGDYIYTEEASPGNVFVFVLVKSKNMGTVKIDVPCPYDMKLIAGGRQYSYESFRGENRYRDSCGEIYPGITAEGYVIFEIPSSTSQATIIVELTSEQEASWLLNV